MYRATTPFGPERPGRMRRSCFRPVRTPSVAWGIRFPGWRRGISLQNSFSKDDGGLHSPAEVKLRQELQALQAKKSPSPLAATNIANALRAATYHSRMRGWCRRKEGKKDHAHDGLRTRGRFGIGFAN